MKTIKDMVIRQVISNGNDLIIIWDEQTLVMKKTDFSKQLPKRGDIIRVKGKIIPYEIILNGKIVYCRSESKMRERIMQIKAGLDRDMHLRIWEEKAPKLREMLAELPEIFRKRIKMLRFNVPDFDILYGEKEISACFEAYKRVCSNKYSKKLPRDASLTDKLTLAYSEYLEERPKLEKAALMYIDDDGIAQPRETCIQKYLQQR